MTARDDYLSLAEFRMADKHPRKQRKRLLKLHAMDETLNASLKPPSGKPKKEKRDKSTGGTMNKLGALLMPKKAKVKSPAELLHVLRLAIVDERLEVASRVLDQIPSHALRKKHADEANHVFLLAVSKRHESLAIKLHERGYPPDVNSPIFVPISAGPGEPVKFSFPSYFMLAVGFGLVNLVTAMLKKANVNQTWYGISPLMVASCIAGRGSASLVQDLLDHHADPHVGLPLELYHLQCKLRTRASRVRNTPSIPGSFSTNVSRSNSFVDNPLLGEVMTSCAPIPQYGQTALKLAEAQERYNTWSAGKVLYAVDLAACCENFDAVHALLKRMNQASVHKSTFAFLVQQDLHITLHLWKNGGNCAMRDWSNLTGLHVAARIGNADLTALYLETPLDVNVVGENGWTALHEAISQGHQDVVRELLRKGAQASIKNGKGETARELALRAGIPSADADAMLETPNMVEKQRDQMLSDLISRTLLSSPNASMSHGFGSMSRSHSPSGKRPDSNSAYSVGIGPNGSSPSTPSKTKKPRRSTFDRLSNLKNQVFSRNNSASSLPAATLSVPSGGGTGPTSPLSPLASHSAPALPSDGQDSADGSPNGSVRSLPSANVPELAIK
ncbi:hypothetical protein RI367_004503 [Sorochytrium milnesiophthora]